MPVLLERERPSEMQLKAVRAHIMRRRQLERLALAEREAREEAALQRKREQEKKKETVEDVKLEISKLETKLESLKNEKHELFLQLKKVLNEDEQKRQKERQLLAPFHNPMIVHRMPYGIMAPRPFGMVGNTPLSATQPLRMEIPSGPGGIKQPTSPLTPLQAYPYPPHPNQPVVHHAPGAAPISEQPPYGPSMTTGQVQAEKHPSGNQPIPANTTTASAPVTPLHIVTSYISSAISNPSPHNQMIIQQADKVHPPVKHSPKPAVPSSTPILHGYPGHHQGEAILHQGKPVLNQPGAPLQQASKHQHQHSQHPQIVSSSSAAVSTAHPKHDTTHHFKQSAQSQNKQLTYTNYPPKPETSQQAVHHKSSSKPLHVHMKTEQHIPQNKHNYPTQPEAVKQEHTHSTRPQQYSIHHYQQQAGVTSMTSSSQQHTKQSSQSTSYPIKEPDTKQSFQMAAAQHTYGYSVQQQPSYSEHQPYLSKSQVTNPATAQVTYPATVQQQQNYSGYGSSKDQAVASQYPQQQQQQPPQHGYQVSQQGYSGQQQYQGYLSQHYQAQPYHGYPAQVEHKGQQQQHQTSTQSSPVKSQSRPSQFDQSKHDQQMPPPPPQKPPPKPEQVQQQQQQLQQQQQQQQQQEQQQQVYLEHFHSSQQLTKRSSHRYSSSSSHPYKREHHSSSSSKPKFSEKYPTSQDDHQGASSQSSRHHYHTSSSKSSHTSKGSSSSSNVVRQSRYH